MDPSRRRRKRKKSNQRREQHQVSQEAMVFLLEESLRYRLKNAKYARELFNNTKKLGQRGRIHIPKHYRFLFCRSCNNPFSIKTARIRLNSKKKQIHYQCLICKKEHRFGYASLQKNIRRQ